MEPGEYDSTSELIYQLYYKPPHGEYEETYLSNYDQLEHEIYERINKIQNLKLFHFKIKNCKNCKKNKPVCNLHKKYTVTKDMLPDQMLKILRKWNIKYCKEFYDLEYYIFKRDEMCTSFLQIMEKYMFTDPADLHPYDIFHLYYFRRKDTKEQRMKKKVKCEFLKKYMTHVNRLKFLEN